MHKKLLLLFILIAPVSAFAQRYSHYFTGTMFDSFENPSQSVFKIDTTQNMAFNFFVPNFTTNAFLTGNGVRTIKEYLFYGSSTNPGLTIGENKFNNAGFNANIYLAMFKLFTSLSGREEIGVSAQIRGEGGAKVTDETLGLFNGATNFTQVPYGSLFNDSYHAQTYHQLSFTYRETLNKKFSIGIKLSALSGIAYNSLDITNSSASFYKSPTNLNDSVILNLAGKYRSSFNNHPNSSDYLPTFRNPGASVSVSIEQHNEDGIYIMYNIKDLGLIYWRHNTFVNSFDSTATIGGLSTSDAGKNVNNTITNVITAHRFASTFTTPTDGRIEISGTKYFWLDDAKIFKYNPVFVASKQIFYRGATGALINNFNFKTFTIGVTTSYDDLKQFDLGGQFMIKSKKAEFFIGCEQVLGANELRRANGGNIAVIGQNSQHLSAGVFMGFALKFGHEIQSHANADYIPMGYEEDGFIKRTFKAIFFKDKPVNHD